jgi:hypothetical protein
MTGVVVTLSLFTFQICKELLSTRLGLLSALIEIVI